jgi:hypothetical protein
VIVTPSQWRSHLPCSFLLYLFPSHFLKSQSCFRELQSVTHVCCGMLHWGLLLPSVGVDLLDPSPYLPGTGFPSSFPPSLPFFLRRCFTGLPGCSSNLSGSSDPPYSASCVLESVFKNDSGVLHTLQPAPATSRNLKKPQYKIKTRKLRLKESPEHTGISPAPFLCVCVCVWPMQFCHLCKFVWTLPQSRSTQFHHYTDMPPATLSEPHGLPSPCLTPSPWQPRVCSPALLAFREWYTGYVTSRD